MLRALSLQDLILIDKAKLDFAAGMVCLTGETGAGKSAVLAGIALSLGQRAESRLVRQGADQATVTACFDNAPHLKAILESHGLPADEDMLILRRQVSADGGSRAYVNDTPCSARLLQELGSHLAQISGQFSTDDLRDLSQHRTRLDSYAQHEDLLQNVSGTYDAWRTAEEALQQAEFLQATRDERLNRLRHQVEELAALAPNAEEFERLSQLRKRMMMHEKLTSGLNAASGALDEHAVPALQRAASELETLHAGGIDFAAPLAAIERALIEIEDASSHLSEQDLDDDNDMSLDKLEARLFALKSTARKYACAPEELEALWQDLETQLTQLEGGEGTLDTLRAQAQAAFEAYEAAAKVLSESRKKHAKALSAAVNKELPALKLDGARFACSVIPQASESGSRHGVDEITFTAAMNAGSSLLQVHKAASGGELSRLQLALCVAMAGKGQPSLMIFDEIDRGVGGATASAIGQRLSALSQNGQVLCITHSAQVAALAAQHILVTKLDSRTSLQVLDNAQRKEELARMLAGAEVTDAARDAAKSLMVES